MSRRRTAETILLGGKATTTFGEFIAYNNAVRVFKERFDALVATLCSYGKAGL